MGFSSKASRPAPIDIAATKKAERQYSLDSNSSDKTRTDSYSPEYFPEYDASDSPPSYYRQDWSSSSKASPSSPPSSRKKTATSPTVNVYTHCGRHSDQYLLRGWGEMVRGIVHKRD